MDPSHSFSAANPSVLVPVGSPAILSIASCTVCTGALSYNFAKGGTREAPRLASAAMAGPVVAELLQGLLET